MIKNHWNGVTNYIKTKIDNAILEGTNSLIQAAKDSARGFRSTKNFITTIYLRTGKLKFNLPTWNSEEPQWSLWEDGGDPSKGQNNWAVEGNKPPIRLSVTDRRGCLFHLVWTTSGYRILAAGESSVCSRLDSYRIGQWRMVTRAAEEIKKRALDLDSMSLELS